MIIKTINRGQAQEAMKIWVDNYPNLPDIEPELMQLRKDLQSINEKVRGEIQDNPEIKKTDYYIDYRFGLLLFDYLRNQKGFTLRVAANDGFWRYLSVKIVPDVVSQRWGKDNDSHFWSLPTRIWLRSIWWYTYLSWQGDLESTENVLSCRHFTTDTILNFEERTGRKGTHIETYRRIIKYYSKVPEEIIREYSKNNKGDDIFRVIMKLNTAKMLVMDPSLYYGGAEAYVKSLFKDVGVDFDVT